MSLLSKYRLWLTVNGICSIPQIDSRDVIIYTLKSLNNNIYMLRNTNIDELLYIDNYDYDYLMNNLYYKYLNMIKDTNDQLADLIIQDLYNQFNPVITQSFTYIINPNVMYGGSPTRDERQRNLPALKIRPPGNIETGFNYKRPSTSEVNFNKPPEQPKSRIDIPTRTMRDSNYKPPQFNPIELNANTSRPPTFNPPNNSLYNLPNSSRISNVSSATRNSGSESDESEYSINSKGSRDLSDIKKQLRFDPSANNTKYIPSRPFRPATKAPPSGLRDKFNDDEL